MFGDQGLLGAGVAMLAGYGQSLLTEWSDSKLLLYGIKMLVLLYLSGVDSDDLIWAIIVQRFSVISPLSPWTGPSRGPIPPVHIPSQRPGNPQTFPIHSSSG